MILQESESKIYRKYFSQKLGKLEVGSKVGKILKADNF